jgi:hypothetical protein
LITAPLAQCHDPQLPLPYIAANMRPVLHKWSAEMPVIRSFWYWLEAIVVVALLNAIGILILVVVWEVLR